MIEATHEPTTAGPVVDIHLLIEEALELFDIGAGIRARKRAMRANRDLMAQALATRAGTVEELRFRLCTLLEVLEHEDTSDWSQDLVRAALADLDHLSGAGPRAALLA